MASTVSTEAEELLTSEPLVAHLATCSDGHPHVAPLWYRYAGDGIVEIMTTGKKLANLAENPRVGLSVQKDEEGHPEWRISLLGTATVVEDEHASTQQNRRLNRKYGADEDDWQENTAVRIEVGSVAVERF